MTDTLPEHMTSIMEKVIEADSVRSIYECEEVAKALASGDVMELDHFIKNNANCKYVRMDDLFTEAINHDNIPMLSYLYLEMVDPNWKPFCFKWGIIKACRKDNIEIIKILLDLGGTHPCIDSIILSGIHMACASNSFDVFMYFADEITGVWITSSNMFKLAVTNGNIMFAEYVLTTKDDVDMSFISAENVHNLVKDGDVEMLKYLKSKIDLTVCELNEELFIETCKKGDIEMVRFLHSINSYFTFDVLDDGSIISFPLKIRDDKRIEITREDERRNSWHVCAVCYEEAKTITECGHILCESCYKRLHKKQCPEC